MRAHKIRAHATLGLLTVALLFGPACRCGSNVSGGGQVTEEEDDVFQQLVGAYRAAAGSDTSVCPDQAVTLGRDAFEGVSYAWEPTTHLSDPQGPQPVFRSADPGKYVYVLKITDGQGREVASAVTVTVVPPPVPVIITNWPTVCAGSALDFDGSGSFAAAGLSIVRYDWDFSGDGTVDANDADPAPVSFPSAGQFTTSLQVTDSLGCQGATTRPLDICGAPTVQFSVSSQRVSETGATVIIGATLNAPATTDIVIPFTLGGSASDGADYTATATQIVIPAGSLSGSVQIQILDDGLSEAEETIVLTLQPSAAAGVGALAIHTVTITDDDLEPVILIDDVAIQEATGVLRFTVTLSEVSGQEVRVDFATSAGTAKTPQDFTATSGTLVFAPGETEKTIDIAVFDDALDEYDELFFMNLTNPVNASLLDLHAVAGGELFGGRTPDLVQGFGTILDDDATPSLILVDVSACEAGGSLCNGVAPGPLVFTLQLSAPSGREVSVRYATNNISALAGADYVFSTAQVDFAEGETIKTVSIDLVDDPLNEDDEDFALDIGLPVNVELLDGQAIGTIVDNDPPPLVTVERAFAAEDGGSMSFVVRLSVPSNNTVSVYWETVDGTALAGSDYTAESGILTFQPGEVDPDQAPSVSLTLDGTIEGDETFFLRLGVCTGLNMPFSGCPGASNAEISDAECNPATIVGDDGAESSVYVVPAAVGEGGVARFYVVRGGLTSNELSVKYETQPGTAGTGDFSDQSGTLSFAADEVVKVVDVTTVDDDTAESTETFVLSLFDLVLITGTGSITNSIGSGTIVDDDGATSSLMVLDAMTVESAGFLCVPVYRTGSTQFAATATFGTLNGDGVPGGNDATAPSDYTAVTGTVRFAAGDAVRSIAIPIIDSDETPGNLEPVLEDFRVTLSNPADTELGDASGIGQIIDDDGDPTFTISDVMVDESAGVALLTVSLTGYHPDPATVRFATQDGTATDGGDYTGKIGTLTFGPFDTQRTISIDIFEDDDTDPHYEATETFTVELCTDVDVPVSGCTAPTNAAVGDGQGLVTITDNEPDPEITISPASGDESASVDFDVELSIKSEVTITVRFDTGADTAGLYPATAGTPPADYPGVTNGLVTFSPLSTLETISITPHDDLTDEENETFIVTLSNPLPSPASIAAGMGTATGTIVDDDDPPTITFVPALPSADETPGPLSFTLQLSQPSAKVITVNYATADGSAKAELDYTAKSGMVTFNPMDPAETVEVELLPDSIYEGDETLTLTLSSPTNATTPSPSEVGTITDDDDPPTISIDDMPDIAETAGSTRAFTVSLIRAAGFDLTVDYDTVGLGASAGLDYDTASGTLIFLAGETTKLLVVEIFNDALDEDPEDFRVDLSSIVVPPGFSASFADDQGFGTIIDEDPLPSLSVDNPSVDEGDSGPTMLTFTVTLSPESGRDVSVPYVTVAGSATEGTDYELASGTLDFVAGDVTETVDVTVNGDTRDENNETVTLILCTGPGTPVSACLAGPTNATVGGDGTGTITDDDDPPTISINNVTLAEGCPSATPCAMPPSSTSFTFTVTLSALSGLEVRVNYATRAGAGAGTASPGLDYSAASGTLIFPPGGAISQDVTITVVGDLLDEADQETFFVDLSSPSNAGISDGEGIGTINDDDDEPTLSIDSIASFPEGSNGATTNATLTVTLSSASGKTVTVSYSTANGTASAPGDYEAQGPLILTFGPGALSQTINVPIVGDVLDEADQETVLVNLSGATNASITGGPGSITIADDDDLPALTINDVTVNETDAGTVDATFTVSLSAVSGRNVAFSYYTADGTVFDAQAVAPGDYEAKPVTAGAISASQPSTTITVLVASDDLDENPETFFVRLCTDVDEPVSGCTAPVNATVADGEEGVGLINDDDDPPSISINDLPNALEDDAPGVRTAVFTVTLDNPSGRTVTVNYATANGTAVAGGDYDAISGTLTFDPNDAIVLQRTQRTITVTLIEDQLDEANETFNVNLTVPVNATISDSLGIGTITDNDGAPVLCIDDRSTTNAPGGTEGNTGTSTMTFTVSLAPPGTTDCSIAFSPITSGLPISATYATADGSATVATNDYVAKTGTIDFPVGESTQTITVTINGDTTFEPPQSFTLNLCTGSGAPAVGCTTAPVNATTSDIGIGTIVNDDSAPTVQFAQAAQSVGTNSSVAIQVVLSAASEVDTFVDFTRTGGTATTPADYSLTTSPLQINAGQTAGSVLLTTTPSASDGATVTLTLSNPSGANLGAQTTNATTISGNLPKVSFEVASVTQSVDEGNGTAFVTLTVRQVGNTSLATSIPFSVTGGTATLVADYTLGTTSPHNFASCPNGATTPCTFTITLNIAHDTLDEANETVIIALGNPTNAELDTQNTVATVTITDNDDTPSFTVSSNSVLEPDSGTAIVPLTVTLSAASGRPTAVTYYTVNGSAVAPGDYTSVGFTTLTFPAGVQGDPPPSQTINFTVNGDLLNEANESFNVVLCTDVNMPIMGCLAPQNATASATPGTVTITNDDPIPGLSINSTPVTEPNTGTVTAVFTVTLDAPSGQVVTVRWGTEDGAAAPAAQAAPPSDYVAVAPSPATTLTFNPGDPLTQTLSVTVNGDLLDEFDETFRVRLCTDVDTPINGCVAPGNASVTTGTGTGTIVDNDALPTLSINDVNVTSAPGTTEGDSGTSTMTFTVTLSAPSGRDVTFLYRTSNGTAVANGDYTGIPTPQLVTISAGQTTAQINVTVIGESLDENNETFNVDLCTATDTPTAGCAAPQNATLSDWLGIGTIVNDDNNSRINIASSSVTEGHSGTTLMTFNVTLNVASGRQVTVGYATASVTNGATVDVDYTAASGTLTFAPNETLKTFTVPVIGDVLDENNETFAVHLCTGNGAPVAGCLAAPTGAIINTGSATGTITDDDNPPTISINDVTVGETAGTNAVFTVTLSAPSGRDVLVDFITAEGSAKTPTDFAELSLTTLTFNPGQTTLTITPIAIAPDTLDEGSSENFFVNLSNGRTGTTPETVTISDNQGQATITDDDNPPTISINDMSITEGDTGFLNVTFTVTLSAASGLPISVQYATSNGTALEGSDYTGIPLTTLNFPAGTTSLPVSVAVLGDPLDEDPETFNVNLSNPTNATIADGLGIGTINDNDATPTLRINDAPVTEGNASNVTATFTVSLHDALGNPTTSGRPVRVDYQTADQSATAGADYNALTLATLTINPGSPSGTINVTVLGDLIDENAETYFVNLTNGRTGVANELVSITDNQGLGTITDNDSPPSISIATPAAIPEGASGSTPLTFVVSLSAASGLPITVQYVTLSGTATGGSDFTSAVNILTFNPGDPTTQNVPISILGDTIYEGNESFTVHLCTGNGTPVAGCTQPPTAVTIGTGAATGTITDDDPAPTVRFSTSAQSCQENMCATRTVNVEYVFSGGTSGVQAAVTVPYSIGTETNAATAGSDYTIAPSSSVTIASLATSATISITVLGDTTPENPETVTLTLGTPSLAAITASATPSVLTISNDDILIVATQALTLDADGDGHIDHLRVTFDKEVRDNTFPGYVQNGLGAVQSIWQIQGYGNVRLRHGSSVATTIPGMSDTVDDMVIYLAFDPTLAFDTGARPMLSTVGNPTLQDLVGNVVTSVNPPLQATDGAGPVIVTATADPGSTVPSERQDLAIVFSEPVSSLSSGFTPPGAQALVAANIVYTNGSTPAGVTGLLDGTDMNGGDGQIIARGAASGVATDFLTTDRLVDKVKPAANAIYDQYGNVAKTVREVPITGIEHPYLLVVASLNQTTVRVTFSEPMGASALVLGNYSVTDNGCTDLQLQSIVAVGAQSYDITTTQQVTGCLYTLTVEATVRDANENATMTDPRSLDFVGNEQLKVVRAEAVSAYSFYIYFSKPVDADDIAPSKFIISAELGAVLGAVPDPIDGTKVLITHSFSQLYGFYTVIAVNPIRVDGQSELLAPNPFDRATFESIFGSPLSVADGPVFRDPFADGSTFAFTFYYRGRIYIGPNDSNAAVFRFLPDGSNPVRAGFLTTSSVLGGPFQNFGVNMTRPSSTVTLGAKTRFYLPPDTNLSPYVGAPALEYAISGCTLSNNRSGLGTSGPPGSGAAIIVDDTLDYIEAGTGGAASTTETCKVKLWRSDGPYDYSGIAAFGPVTVSTPVAGTEYLLYGAHFDDTSNNYNELHFTDDDDLTLNNVHCNVSNATLGNTQDLQSIYGYGNKAFIAFAGPTAQAPKLATIDLSPTTCAASPNVTVTGNGDARNLPGLGGSGGNTAEFINIDSMFVYDAGDGARVYAGNNGGIAVVTNQTLPSPSAVWSRLIGDAFNGWTGTTRQLLSVGAARPGEKGVPYMAGWDGYLFVGRNRSDNCPSSGKPCAEVWRYRATDAQKWVKIVDTSSTAGLMNTNNARLSLLAVSGGRLYVGFDNESNGAELWVTKLGTTAAGVASNSSFELAKNRVTLNTSTSGLGIAGAPDLIYNKYIFSHATATYVDGNSYLYLTVGCNTDFRDNGACDRNRTLGRTDFSIRLFRQVD